MLFYPPRASNLIPPKSLVARIKQLPYLLNTFTFPAIVKMKWYVSLPEVSQKTGLIRTTVKLRCLFPPFSNYIWLNDISGKKLSLNKYIKNRIKEFNLKMSLANVYSSPETRKRRRYKFKNFYKQQLFKQKNKDNLNE